MTQIGVFSRGFGLETPAVQLPRRSRGELTVLGWRTQKKYLSVRLSVRDHRDGPSQLPPTPPPPTGGSGYDPSHPVASGTLMSERKIRSEAFSVRERVCVCVLCSSPVSPEVSTMKNILSLAGGTVKYSFSLRGVSVFFALHTTTIISLFSHLMGCDSVE